MIPPLLLSFLRSGGGLGSGSAIGSGSRGLWGLLLQQGVGHQLEGSLRVGHDPLDGLELLLHGVDGGVLGHDVPVVWRVRPTHTRLETGD